MGMGLFAGVSTRPLTMAEFLRTGGVPEPPVWERPSPPVTHEDMVRYSNVVLREAERMAILAFLASKRARPRSPGRRRRSPQQVTREPTQGVKHEAAQRVLTSLYSDGIPDPVTLPNKALCKAVAAQLPYQISNDTILRAAGRK